jgi:hypothetical protein
MPESSRWPETAKSLVEARSLERNSPLGQLVPSRDVLADVEPYPKTVYAYPNIGRRCLFLGDHLFFW